MRAGSLLADLFSISIADDENDPVHWFATWLGKQPYGGRCRRLKLWVKWRNFGDFGQESTVSMVELEPGTGPHLFRYRGRCPDARGAPAARASLEPDEAASTDARTRSPAPRGAGRGGRRARHPRDARAGPGTRQR